MEDQINQNSNITPTQTDDAGDKDMTVDSLFAVEGLIKNHLAKIEETTVVKRQLKEMFDDYLINDPEYSTATEEAKEATKKKTIARKAALSKPEADSIVSKLQDAKENLKSFQESLSNHLREYGRLSGSDQFEIEPGDIRQIVYKAKLVKSSMGR